MLEGKRNGNSFLDLATIVRQIYPLPEASLSELLACASLCVHPKGFHILKAGKSESDIFFLAQGIVRAYVLESGKKVTFWIGKEGDAVLSLRSYVRNEPGYENMELLEDSILYCLRRKDLFRLYEKDIHIANWGRKFAELEFLRTEEKMIPLLFTTAAVRYEYLLKRNPELLQRVPLECLASYLGITPVSLSRIRSQLKKP